MRSVLAKMETVYMDRNPTAKAILELVRSAENDRVCYDHFAFRTFGVRSFSLKLWFVESKLLTHDLITHFFFPFNRWMVTGLIQWPNFSWISATQQRRSWDFPRKNCEPFGSLLPTTPSPRPVVEPTDPCQGYLYPSFSLTNWARNLR